MCETFGFTATPQLMYHYSQFCKFFKEISNSLCAKQKFFLCGGTPWVKSLLVQQIEMVKSCFSQLVWPWRITTQKYLQDSPHINSDFGLSEKCLPYFEYVHTSNFFFQSKRLAVFVECVFSKNFTQLFGYTKCILYVGVDYILPPRHISALWK